MSNMYLLLFFQGLSLRSHMNVELQSLQFTSVMYGQTLKGRKFITNQAYVRLVKLITQMPRALIYENAKAKSGRKSLHGRRFRYWNRVLLRIQKFALILPSLNVTLKQHWKRAVENDIDENENEWFDIFLEENPNQPFPVRLSDIFTNQALVQTITRIVVEKKEICWNTAVYAFTVIAQIMGFFANLATIALGVSAYLYTTKPAPAPVVNNFYFNGSTIEIYPDSDESFSEALIAQAKQKYEKKPDKKKTEKATKKSSKSQQSPNNIPIKPVIPMESKTQWVERTINDQCSLGFYTNEEHFYDTNVLIERLHGNGYITHNLNLQINAIQLADNFRLHEQSSADLHKQYEASSYFVLTQGACEYFFGSFTERIASLLPRNNMKDMSQFATFGDFKRALGAEQRLLDRNLCVCNCNDRHDECQLDSSNYEVVFCACKSPAEAIHVLTANIVENDSANLNQLQSPIYESLAPDSSTHVGLDFVRQTHDLVKRTLVARNSLVPFFVKDTPNYMDHEKLLDLIEEIDSRTKFIIDNVKSQVMEAQAKGIHYAERPLYDRLICANRYLDFLRKFGVTEDDTSTYPSECGK